EVDALAGLLRHHRGAEHHGVPPADQDRAARLLGDGSRRDGDLLTGHLERLRDFSHVPLLLQREAWDPQAELEPIASRPGFRRRAPEDKPGGVTPPASLPPEPQLRYQRAIAPDVSAAQVVQQSAALANQQHQTATRVMVLLVDPEVLRELQDPLGEDGDLYL